MTGNLVGFKNKEAAFKAMKEKLGVDPNSKFNSKSITVATTLLAIGRDNTGTGQEK